MQPPWDGSTFFRLVNIADPQQLSLDIEKMALKASCTGIAQKYSPYVDL